MLRMPTDHHSCACKVRNEIPYYDEANLGGIGMFTLACGWKSKFHAES